MMGILTKLGLWHRHRHRWEYPWGGDPKSKNIEEIPRIRRCRVKKCRAVEWYWFCKEEYRGYPTGDHYEWDVHGSLFAPRVNPERLRGLSGAKDPSYRKKWSEELEKVIGEHKARLGVKNGNPNPAQV